jgi:hypothetical protein
MYSAKCIGILSAQQVKIRKAFSFEYDKNWINSEEQLLSYFRLSEKEMNFILDEMRKVIAKWQVFANEIEISRGEQTLMEGAFKV